MHFILATICCLFAVFHLGETYGMAGEHAPNNVLFFIFYFALVAYNFYLLLFYHPNFSTKIWLPLVLIFVFFLLSFFLIMFNEWNIVQKKYLRESIALFSFLSLGIVIGKNK